MKKYDAVKNFLGNKIQIIKKESQIPILGNSYTPDKHPSILTSLKGRWILSSIFSRSPIIKELDYPTISLHDDINSNPQFFLLSLIKKENFENDKL
jgi:hypothetical protein